MGNHPLENNRDERLRRRLQPEWNERCIIGKGRKAKSVGGRFKLLCHGVDIKLSRNSVIKVKSAKQDQKLEAGN